MELRVLEYYLMVAREENITKAAELLHITQPTLSRQLAQMEEELGVRLFTRGRHSITLTEDGMLLKRRAQEIVELADKTRRDLKHDEQELSGKIYIGSGEVKSMRVFADCIAKFHCQHPKVIFDIYSGTADEIKEQIERGLMDIGLLAEPVDVAKYMFIRLSEKVRWGVLARKDSLIAKKEYVTAKDLADIPLLVPKRSSVQTELANWFKDEYDKVNVVVTYNLLYNAAVLAESMNGAVLCTEHDKSYETLTFIPLEPMLTTGSVLVWKKGQFVSNLVKSFIEHLRNAEKAFYDI